jgi:hypothetical protein
VTEDKLWQEFDDIGEEGVRKELAGNSYSEGRKQQAYQWLEHRQSLASSDVRSHTLALANEANDLARAANKLASEANVIALDSASSAKRSAEAARISNTIATLALAAAMIAIVVSIIGLLS